MKTKGCLKKCGIAAGAVVVLVTAFLLRFPPDPHVNCHKALSSALDIWLEENSTNVYPNVRGDSAASFALIQEYFRARDASLYGYVPGLTWDDPKELIMIYLKRMTRRTWNGDHSASIFGKKKWFIGGPDYWWNPDVDYGGLPEGGQLVDTAEFVARLRMTLALLEKSNRPYWTNVVKEHSEFVNSIENDTSHFCISALKYALEAYAQDHGGAYPTGQATPEASLSLLHREGYVDAHTLSGDWHYVEGLRNDDHESIALLWSKTRRGHYGERRKDRTTQVLFVAGRMDWVPTVPEDKWSSFVDHQEHLLFDHGQQSSGVAPVLKVVLRFPDGRMVNEHHGGFARICSFQLADGTSWSNTLSKPKLMPQYLRSFRCPIADGIMKVSLDMDTHHLVSDIVTVRFQNGNATPSNVVLHMKRVPCTHK